MNSDGSSPANVTNNSLPDFAPDWQPLVGVGGIAELPDLAMEPLGARDSSPSSVGLIAAVVGIVLAVAVALVGGALYTRRQRLRS